MTSRFLPLRASLSADRLAWCAVVPTDPLGWAVVVHGSDRDPVGMVRQLRGWAELRRVALFAPLFPVGVPVRGDGDGYKSLRTDGYAFDQALLSMLAEAADETSTPTGPFLLLGFSGGAQFAHRFTLRHPERVAALSMVAPGNVTLLGNGRRWWAGVADAEQALGRPVDLAALCSTPVQALVGGDDDGRQVIRIRHQDSRWVEGANDAGVTRGERLQSLADDWRAHGVDVEHRVLEGVGHEFAPFAPAIQSFFDGHLVGLGDTDPGESH